MFTLNTILYPTDFSKPSEYALQFACAIARDHKALLVILHVSPIPPAFVGGEMVLPVPSADYKEQIWESFRKLEATEPRIRELRVETKVIEGDPAYEIVSAAKEMGANLIVMGTHGRTGLGRLIMGSVAEQVLRKASCPVLTVKHPSAVAVDLPMKAAAAR